jgi:hypothetical protein
MPAKDIDTDGNVRSKTMKRIFGLLIISTEAAALVYTVFMSYLLTAWMETDAFAVQATNIDWWVEGGKRLLIVGLGASFVACISMVGNGYLFRWLGLRLALFSAIAVFVLMVAAGMIGAIEFAVTKPFM